MPLRLMLITLLALLPRIAFGADAEKKKVLFIAGGPSHGFGAHDHLSGCNLLANKLKEAKPGYDTLVSQGWPKDEKQLDGVDAVVMYCDGGPRHLGIPHTRTL